MLTPQNEPPFNPDDTNPSRPVAPPSGIEEPPVRQGDTEPRPPVTEAQGTPGIQIEEPPVLRSDTQPRIAGETGDEPERGGCGNPLLIGAVLLVMACMFLTTVGLAGFAGARDGTNILNTRHAVTLVSVLSTQAVLARDDCSSERFELCLERCKFIATAQPNYPGAAACINTAQNALNVTPTAAPTNTAAPPTAVPVAPTAPAATTAATTQTGPTLAPTANPAGDSGFSREELFVRGQEAYRVLDYETAVKWLEALRGLDADFQRKDVEDMLVNSYMALGKRYENERRLSEMVFVIRKALKIRPLTGTDWELRLNAVELYLSARNYAAAGDYKRAATVYDRMLALGIAPSYLDAKVSACDAFAKAGETGLATKNKC